MEQSVGWVDLPDGTSVAFATAGVGPPLLFVGGWLSHLELSWDLRAERAFLEALATGRTLVRYDRSGCGMSDRPKGSEWSLDLEEVSIHAVMLAVGVTKFDLMGSSLGVPIAIDWAARHPETVNRLVLYGGWARGQQVAAPQVRDHVVGLIRSAWGLGSDVLTEMFAPEASAETRAALSNYQRKSPQRRPRPAFFSPVTKLMWWIASETSLLQPFCSTARMTAPHLWSRASSSHRASKVRVWSNSRTIASSLRR